MGAQEIERAIAINALRIHGGLFGSDGIIKQQSKGTLRSMLSYEHIKRTILIVDPTIKRCLSNMQSLRMHTKLKDTG